ncbi:TonB-dependent receptor [Phenylobacterium sp. LjRoot219]|uniref:TonB-dependent receptor n=1 Tax=Phenylobacterium sp. LjRoot219 TaxID=3342283 RepID=UPI003ED025E6
MTNNRPEWLKAALWCGCALSALAASESAYAQSAQSATLGEIVVTAQRRAERLEDVPMAITAITPEAAEARGIRNVQDLGQAVAGVQVNFQGSFTYPAVRGITSLTTGIGFENNVALYIDGFYQPDSIAVNADFANIEGLQVLKGPQGALYGRNATGGALLLTTLRPSATLEGKLDARYGNFNDGSISGYVSGPITERVRASVAGYARKTDGYYDFLDASGQKTGDAAPLKSAAVRAKVEAELTDDLVATLAYNYIDHEDARGSMFTNEQFRSALLPPKVGRLYEPRTFASNRGRPATDAIVKEGTLTLAWQTPVGALKSYTGYANRQMKTIFDFDGSWADLSFSNSRYFADTFQQGVDFNLTSIENLDLIVGGSYYSDRTKTAFSDGFSGNRLLARQTNTFQSEAWAAFADGTYHFNEKLSFNLGGRYTVEERKVRFAATSFPSLLVSQTPENPSKTYRNFSPRASIRYEIEPGTNVYAQISRGFRTGFQQVIALSPTVAQAFDIKPEKITAYEIGFKTARSNLRFDAAAFYYDYKDLQVGITVPNPLTPAVPINLTSNADKAEVYGVEAQTTWAPIEHLEISVSAAWLHARYEDFANATANGFNATTRLNVPNQRQDWSGHEMARAPEFSATLGLTYTIPEVFDGDLEATANVKYTDGYVLNNPSLFGPLAGPALADEQRYRQGAYTLMNAALNWTDQSDKYVLGVWVNNLTDEDYRLSRNGSTFGDYGVWASPRTYGVRVGYRY